SVDEDDLYRYSITTQDPDNGDTRTIVALSKPDWLNLTDNGDGTAILQGVPVNDNVGDHSVVLEVEDAVGTKVGQSFTVTVNNVNDPPGFTSQPVLSALQDQLYRYDIITSDPDLGDILTVEATLLPAWLSFSDLGGGTASLSGTPQNQDSGDHDVALRVTDQAGAAVEQLFTITVGNANDAPVFTSTPIITANEDVLYEYNIVTTDADVGDTRNIVDLSLPDWLELIDNGNGTASLAGTPTNSDVGDHPVVLRVVDQAGADNNQNFTISVTNVNDRPLFTSTPVTTAQQGLEYNYIVITVDQDAGDSRNITATTLPSWLNLADNGDGTASLTGTPTNADLGVHPVVLVVEDVGGLSDTQSFSVTADNTNDPPVFVTSPSLTIDEDSNYEYLVEVTDPDVGDVITLDIIAPSPAWLNFVDNGAGNGTLSGTPTNAEVGFHEVTLQARDITGQSTLQNFEIEVINTNDPPVFTSTPVLEINEDDNYEYLITAFDPDFIYNGFIPIVEGVGLPDWLEVVDNLDGTWSLFGTPINADVGTASIKLVVVDQENEQAEQNFNIEVINVNDAPEIVSSAPTQVLEDNEYTYDIEAIDVDLGDEIALSATMPDWLSLEDNGDGTGRISGIPNNDDVGSHVLKYRATDLAGAVDSVTLTIDVINTNDAPEFISVAPIQVQPGTMLEYQVIVEDVDAGDEVNLEAIILPDWLNFILTTDNTGVVSGMVPQFSAERRVLLQVTDRSGLTTQQDFNLIINNPPVLATILLNVAEDVNGILTGPSFNNAFVDSENDNIDKVIITSLPASGELRFNGNAVGLNEELDFDNSFQLIYVPNENFFGVDGFTWNASDGLVFAQSEAQIEITITAVNDPPQLANIEPEALVYRQGDPAIPVTESLILSDIDSDSISFAIFQIVDNFISGEDVLRYLGEDVEGLTFNYNDDSGILSIDGANPKSVYENVLRQVGYSNSNFNDTSPLVRRVAILVNDGFLDSEIAFRSIGIEEITPELDIVTAFTPNDDGVNDTWNIQKLDFYTSVRVSIYSTDGTEVFVSDGYENEWDGTANGQLLANGPYLYVIKVERNQRQREFKGTVTILK
ncbi:MAG: putative Ig domain-containing protein, partial [Bacteroidota bacterium]